MLKPGFMGSLLLFALLAGAINAFGQAKPSGNSPPGNRTVQPNHPSQAKSSTTPARPGDVFKYEDARTAEIARDNALGKKLLLLDIAAEKEFREAHPTAMHRNWKLPKPTVAAFDWCNLNMVSDAHRQLNGDCWANAASEALECSILIRNNRRAILSVQPILDHLKLHEKEIGGKSSMAFDFFLKTGTTIVQRYPYSGKPSEPMKVALPYRAVAWGYVSTTPLPSVAEIKATLVSRGPLAVDVLTTPKFIAYKGGYFNEPNPPNPNHVVTDHAVLLVGWDDSRGPHGAWKIKNTWGSDWGEQGFMWIDYASNYVGMHAAWVRASCFYFDEPPQFAELVPDAKPLPRHPLQWDGKPIVKHSSIDEPEKETAKTK